MANTAYIYQAKSGNWNVSFHHPLCKDGGVGKKIHRGLKVADEADALRLKQQINELLILAEKSPTNIPSRTVAESKYEQVIVGAFYDCLTPEPIDYMSIRDRLMPFPPRAIEGQTFPRIMLTGTTGVGKSRVVQHLLQTTDENFPKRGAGRTTVADTEIVVADTDFAAAITFYSENEIREILKDNILEACEFARMDHDNAKISSKLLVDSSKKFRFNFVLGNPPSTNEEIDTDDDDEDEENSDELFSASANERRRLDAPIFNIDKYVDSVKKISEEAWQKAEKDLNPQNDADRKVVEEYWIQYADLSEVDELAEAILEELGSRLRHATGDSSWPLKFQIPETKSKKEFFERLIPFYQNNYRYFGSLVTPLVQGLRVRGRFMTTPDAKKKFPGFIFLDGQGLGHDQEQATKKHRVVPPEITGKFSQADVICLIEKSVPAMIGDAPMLLQEIVSRGYIDKLALVFTHFEAVSAPDLDAKGKRAKVLEAVSGVIQSIESIPKGEKAHLEKSLEERSFFLGYLNKQKIDSKKGTVSELAKLCERCSVSVKPLVPPKRYPLFNEYRLADIIEHEIQRFRDDWSAVELAVYHWKIMEALTNWIGNAYGDGYPKRSLYPAHDLSRRLIEVISKEIENPKEWVPSEPKDQEEKSLILNAIRDKVSQEIDRYCRSAVIHDPRTLEWLPAYSEISGTGSRKIRARRVARILEDRASLPNEGLGQFVKGIWEIVLNSSITLAHPEGL